MICNRKNSPKSGLALKEESCNWNQLRYIYMYTRDAALITHMNASREEEELSLFYLVSSAYYLYYKYTHFAFIVCLA